MQVVDTILALNRDYTLLQVLNVASQIRLFDMLEEPQTVIDLAKTQNWDPTVTALLLEVLVQAGYLNTQGKRFWNTEQATRHLQRKSFWRINHLVEEEIRSNTFASKLYDGLLQKTVFDDTEPSWHPERLRQIGVNSFYDSLPETVGACDLSGAKRLLDLGGGHGLYSVEFAKQYPELEVVVFDLPEVLPLTETVIAQFALQERIKTQAGSFLTDEIGSGYDVVLCANILHSDKRELVLSKVWQALTPGGKIIVKSRIDDSPQNLAVALAKVKWHIQGGRELYTQQEWYDFIAQHGFHNLRTVTIAGIFATMIGEK